MKKKIFSTVLAGLLCSSMALATSALVPVAVHTDDEAPDYLAAYSIDGDLTKFWHTMWEPTQNPLPISVYYDLGQECSISGVTITPRQDESDNGLIYEFKLYVSSDNENFTEAAHVDTFEFTKDPQSATFPAVTGRYIQLEAIDTELGFVSINEIDFAATPVAPAAEETEVPVVEETETPAVEETEAPVVEEVPAAAENVEEEAPQTGDPITLAVAAAITALGAAYVTKRK